MIEVRELTKYYGNGENRFQVLKNIGLSIRDGEFTVILGASGWWGNPVPVNPLC